MNVEKILNNSGVLPLKNFRVDEVEYSGDLSHPDWVRKIFLFLANRNHSERDSQRLEVFENESLRFSFKLKRHHHTELGEWFSFEGECELSLVDECVRCLEDTNQQVTFTIHTALVDERFLEDDFWGEQDVMEHEGECLDLCFFEKNQLDLESLLTEECLLQLSDFPLHDPDCLGLCGICGENLNKNPCEHFKNSRQMA